MRKPRLGWRGVLGQIHLRMKMISAAWCQHFEISRNLGVSHYLHGRSRLDFPRCISGEREPEVAGALTVKRLHDTWSIGMWPPLTCQRIMFVPACFCPRRRCPKEREREREGDKEREERRLI